MREIRFRGWDKEAKSMFYPSSVCWKDGFMWACDAKGNNRVEMVVENSELMQFTGLRNKNGKEIYEGDIVESRYESMGSGEIVSRNPVVWIAPCFSIGGKQMQYNPLGTIAKAWQKDQTVIGNIHENPELLKEA